MVSADVRSMSHEVFFVVVAEEQAIHFDCNYWKVHKNTTLQVYLKSVFTSTHQIVL